ncbi:MAG: right-handed parallel beta-helix repeat-containing protein [Planctomycetota bacterium]
MKTAFILVAVLSLPVVAFSATIYVPDNYPNIQGAIDAAVEGDTVIVKPGTYVENIDFKGKAITVRSSDGAEVTFIDGNQVGRVVEFVSGETLDSILMGFTITNGYSASGGGGGIRCEESSPTITNNTITGNSTVYNGGGIACDESDPSIMNNIISANSANKWGGGIHCKDHSSPDILNNIISDNSAGKDGGGIMCYMKSTATIKNNVITGNSIVEEYGYGGGICCMNSDATISGNTISYNDGDFGGGITCFDSDPLITVNFISGNTAFDGGGILCELYTSPIIDGNIILSNVAWEYPFEGGGGITCNECTATISNNLIAGNMGYDGGGIFAEGPGVTLLNNTISGNIAAFGGGISIPYSTVTITNTILWNNDAAYGKEICIGFLYSAELTISYSDVAGGQENVYVGSSSILNWGPGMIDVDPVLVDPGYWDDNGTPGDPGDDFWVDGDFHLTYNSLCRDTGDNSAVAESCDFEGDPRIAWSGTVDMGADEFYTHLYCTGDYIPGGSIEGKLVGLPGTSPVSLFLGSGVLDPALPTAWGNFHLQAPWLLIPLVPIPGDGVLVLPATIPGTPPAPYDLPMQALIGLEPDSLTNLYVLEVR